MITSNLGLNIPDFDASPWHDLVNNNFKSIDAIVHTMFGITNVKGVYANSIAVSAGDRYVDPVTTELYEVVTGYVTAPAPTTFSADRALNPTNWLLVDASAALNGLAQMLTIRSEVLAARDEVNNDQEAINTIVASLHMPAVATIGGTPIIITDWDNAKNYPNTVIYAASAASLLPSGFEFGVVGSPGRAGLGFYYSLDANNGYIIIVALASGNRWYRRYEGGIWLPWSKNPNMNEIVRRDFQLTGNAETSVDAATTQGADVYKIVAGASNLPTWAGIGDTMLAFNTGVNDGSLIIVGRNGKIATKGKTAGVWSPWFDAVNSTAAVPTGSIIWTAGNTAPLGFYKANGALKSRISDAALFSVIGTTYGVGDGSTTFNLPDLRGEFIRSLDDGRGVDIGRTIGSSQAAMLLNHTHSGTTSNDGAHTHNAIVASGGGGATTLNSSPGAAVGNSTVIQSSGVHSHTVTTGNPDVGGGNETRPRNIALLACIKY